VAAIAGTVTTFNAPNYVGELFQVSPVDTPFLSSIGGLTGGQSVNSIMFTWETTDLRAADNTRQRLEGANAPAAEGRSRAAAYNVVEIHQEALAISYTKLAASGQFANSGAPAGVNAASLDGNNNTINELDFQVSAHLKQIARDIEKTFLVGTFQHPADNVTPRKTRGLLSAISTNVTAAAAAAPTAKMINDMAQTIYDNGGMQEGETRTLIVPSNQKRNLTTLFVTNKGFVEPTRNVGGVNLDTIYTDFGQFNVMVDRYMPNDTIAFVSLEECAPVFLEIPGKGFLFVEPLAKTGSAENYQIYGEVGLNYGNELKHGKITGLAPAVL
jgi:hypothetical protein